MHAKDNLHGWPKRSVVVGIFADRATADRAVTELRRVGFRTDQIGVVTRHDLKSGTAKVEGEGSHWEEGAAVGALAGLGAGGLVGLGVLAGVIPVIGPIIAGGTLAVIMANAAGGAVIGGIVGALAGLGIPEEEARYYENEVKAGRTVVTIKAENRIAEAVDVLQSHGAQRYQEGAQCVTACATTEDTMGMSQVKSVHSGTSEKVQVREEVLTPRKDVTSGEVRVRKEVITEHKTINVPVQREEVVIERRPVSGTASSTPIRPGEEVRIAVKEEHVRVEKHPVVKEEIEISKRVVQGTEQVSGTVKKERVHIEEKGGTNVSRTTNSKNRRNDK